MPNSIETVTTILTFVILISNFILMIAMWIDKIKSPWSKQDARIDCLENRVNDLYEASDKDKDRIKELEKGTVVTQEALLALMTHSIDGNHIDELTKARDDLHTYLTHKGVQV